MVLVGVIGGLTFVTIALMVVLMRLVLRGGETASGAISAVYGAYQTFMLVVLLYLFGGGVAAAVIGTIEFIL